MKICKLLLSINCGGKKGTDIPSTFFESSKSLKNETLQYWKIYFDFTYYLCLLPFRFRFNIATRTYDYLECSMQRVLCKLLGIITAIYYVLKIRQMYISGNGKENPEIYFHLAYYFCDTLLLNILFFIFGRKGQEISVQIFSELQKTYFVELPYNSSIKSYKKAKLVSRLICTLCILSLVLYLFELLQDYGWTLFGVWTYFENDAKLVFFRNFGGQFTGQNGTRVPICLTVISIVSNFHERLLNAFSDILFVLTTLMFRNLVKHFTDALKPSHTSVEKIMEHYNWLRMITDKLNSTMGLAIGCFLFGNLPFYVTNVFDIFKCSNVFLKARYLFYCLYFFPSLFVAARSNKNVDAIKHWIYEERNFSQIGATRLSVFLHELSFQSVGLSSSGCLTVNYNMFGTIISIIFTYALLKTQFNKDATLCGG